MDLDLRRLRYFVAVAEELSFVRAASRLYMTQPALSRQIQALEEDLGVTLFDRNRRFTRLTGAGIQLLEDAEAILASSTALQRRVRLADRVASHFTIGFMPGVIVTPIIAEFTALAPQVQVSVVHTTLTDQAAFLLDGRVDVCFVRLPLEEESLAITPLFPEPRVAVLPVTHPLSAQAAVPIGALAELPLLQDPRDVPEWTDRTGRVPPEPGEYPVVIEERLENVAIGRGFAVLPAGLAGFYQRPDIAYVPLQDVAPRMVALAHSQHRKMPELEQFAEISRKFLGPEST